MIGIGGFRKDMGSEKLRPVRGHLILGLLDWILTNTQGYKKRVL